MTEMEYELKNAWRVANLYRKAHSKALDRLRELQTERARLDKILCSIMERTGVEKIACADGTTYRIKTYE